MSEPKMNKRFFRVEYYYTEIGRFRGAGRSTPEGVRVTPDRFYYHPRGRHWWTEEGWRRYGIQMLHAAIRDWKLVRIVTRTGVNPKDILYLDRWQAVLLPERRKKLVSYRVIEGRGELSKESPLEAKLRLRDERRRLRDEMYRILMKKNPYEERVIRKMCPECKRITSHVIVGRVCDAKGGCSRAIEGLPCPHAYVWGCEACIRRRAPAPECVRCGREIGRGQTLCSRCEE
jgi:hypothetical protein